LYKKDEILLEPVLKALIFSNLYLTTTTHS